jgi:hypothetical protein
MMLRSPVGACRYPKISEQLALGDKDAAHEQLDAGI